MARERLDNSLRQRETIETIGRRWAQRSAAEVKARTRAILIIRETGEYQRILNLPNLTGEQESLATGVRFDEVGNLYTTTWPVKKTEEGEDGKIYLFNPEGFKYRVLNRKRVRRNFFENLPKNLPVRELLFHQFDDNIESAIRHTRHILEGYAPGGESPEVIAARRVIEYTDQLAYRFISESMTEAGLEQLSRETWNFLESVNLLDPKDPDKKKMLVHLKASSRKDSLGRYNPLVARVRARAAYLAATRRLIVSGQIIRKFGTNENILLFERETTRWALETAGRQLGVLLSHADFQRPDGKSTEKQRAAIANILLNISHGHLALPRVKVYIQAARYAAINLVGIRDFKKDVNRRILGDEVAKDLFGRKPTRTLVIEGRFSEAKDRIEESMAVINTILYKYASIEREEETS